MEMDVFLYRTKSAFLPAMKTVSVIEEAVQTRIRRMNATSVTVFPLMKISAGDHNPIPAIKMAASATAQAALKVMQEFIISVGFSELGRKRMIASPRPTKLSIESRFTAEIRAAAVPTSATL